MYHRVDLLYSNIQAHRNSPHKGHKPCIGQTTLQFPIGFLPKSKLIFVLATEFLFEESCHLVCHIFRNLELISNRRRLKSLCITTPYELTHIISPSKLLLCFDLAERVPRVEWYRHLSCLSRKTSFYNHLILRLLIEWWI